MTTDPQPARSAGLPDEGEPPTTNLVPVASRPLDLFHDEMMAKAAADHEKRMAAETPAADRAALREQVAAALLQRIKRATVSKQQPYDAVTSLLAATEYDLADAVMSVLPASTARAPESEPPLSPDYEHPECGFHWHGRNGMDIPMRDGQPVCPRCELRTAEERLGRIGEWVTSDVVTARNEFGNGYREAQRDIRDLINQAPAASPVHVGGNVNAEDCPACTGSNPPYPFICPGPDTAETEVVHGCPPDGSGLTPCCGRTPFELPRTDRISSEAPVTCPAAAPAQPSPECSASTSGNCLRESQSETACDTEAGECVYGGRPAAVVARPAKEAESPRTVCVCSHTRAEHLAVSGRLLCDACDPDSTDNLVCRGFDAL